MGGRGSGRRVLGVVDVEGLLRRFGRPLTTFEIHFLLGGEIL